MSETKKKLLYIVTQAEWGGAQRYIFDLTANLSQDFDITVAVGKPQGRHDFIDKLTKNKEQRTNTINVIRLRHLTREISPIQDLLAVLEIAKLYKTLKPDIVHLNSSKAGVIGSLAKLLFVPYSLLIVYTAHGWAYLEPLSAFKRWIYLLMEKLAAGLRDATIALSEKEKNIALKHGTAKRNSVFVIPNGIDLNSLSFLSRAEARKHLGIEENQFVIGTIANLYKTKGLGYLIEAFHLLNSKSPIPNSKFLIIGEGPERKNLELRIKNYELSDKVILTGSIHDASQYLKAFDIFVLPSVKEGFPYTILEAMAAGLPIVATDVGAIPEILENQKSGLIVPPANLEILAKALKNLLDNPQKTQELGKNAAETVKQFTLDKTIKKTKTVYELPRSKLAMYRQ